jgi:bacteriocin biosynthesis cyclodehydratase domain-containing protein
VLRPGTHVLRRSATELQVGLDPRRAVVLPDLPEVRALLDALRSPATGLSEAQYAAPTLAQLAGSGLLVDADVLLPLAPALPVRDTVPDPESHSGRHHNARPHDTGPARQTVSRTDVAALATVAGDRVPALLEARSRARVEVVSSGSREAHALAGELVGLLSGAGMRPNLLAHGQSPAAATAHSPEPLAGVLVCVGEPPREAVDAWMRAGTPHLLLRLTEGHAVIGPFVLPGETACLRCLDAHHTDVDPAWPLLVTQYASAVTREREDTVPEPVDALLAAIACAWAAREIVSHAEGRRPATASATVGLDPHLTALETHCWPRHPDCGCGWA